MRIRLLDAAKLLSRVIGVAPGSLAYIERILLVLKEHRKYDIDKIAKKAFGNMRNPRNTAKAFLNLAYYLDLVDFENDVYFLTSLGEEFTRKIQDNSDTQEFHKRLFLLERALSWPPMEFFIRYVIENIGCHAENLEKDLGSQMRFYSKIIAKYNLIENLQGGIKKPFNIAIIRGLLYKLAVELGLLEKTNPSGPYIPTDIAYRLLGTLQKEEEIIWTRHPNERYILAALIQILRDDQRIIIVTPWLERRIVEEILLEYKEKISKIFLRGGEKFNEESIKLLNKSSNIEVVEVPKTGFSAIHSKMVAGQKSFMISSANITYRSLYNNLEVGVYIENKSQTHKIRNMIKKMLEA